LDKRSWGIWLVNVAGYWSTGQRCLLLVNVADYLEGIIMFNYLTVYLHYGPVQPSILIDADCTVTTEAKFTEIMNYVYDNRHNILIVETKAWDVINKIMNPRGLLFNPLKPLPSSAVLQNMRREIRNGARNCGYHEQGKSSVQHHHSRPGDGRADSLWTSPTAE
jgi:hypothetical protein